MARPTRRLSPGYIAVLLAAFTLAVGTGWTNLAERVDGSAYDWIFRLHPAQSWPAEAVVLSFDEDSLSAIRGVRNLRGALAAALDRITPAGPSVVAIDLILADESEPAQDEMLERALARVPVLVLASDIIPGTNRWEDPLPRFMRWAKAVGHVHAAPDPVSRVLPLEKAAGRDRRWAVALEAYRLHSGGSGIEESPTQLKIAGLTIPAVRSEARALAIRYRHGIPRVSVHQLLSHPAAAGQFRGKAVFVGITAQSAARDRLMTPLEEQMMSGVEIHAQAFETLSHGRFLVPASNLLVIVTCAAMAVIAGLIFLFLSGWAAYCFGALLIVSAHAIPHLAFAGDVIFPYVAPAAAAWLSVVFAASWQYFFVKRQLRKSESDKARYQQAIHFVTHEMRSPLTAIQGSSELMGRYNLNEEKRKQMAEMINSESKRLARMIQTFLDIERLTDGQMELRRDEISIPELIQTCMQRAQPLAERKNIRVEVSKLDRSAIIGDRELMEYAIYNLLTNAIKYSPSETVVTVDGSQTRDAFRISVRDQGIGMDEKELGSIFQKFYRTRKAEASGEVGTGIGLSIVDQIVAHHRGRMEVTSEPGKGSCFTMVLPGGIGPSPLHAS